LIELIGFLRAKGRKELFWQWRWNGPRCLAFRPLWIYIIFLSDIAVDWVAAVYSSYSLLLNRSLACKHHYSNFSLKVLWVGAPHVLFFACTDCNPPLQAISILSVLKYRSFLFYPKSIFYNFNQVYRKIYLYLRHIS